MTRYALLTLFLLALVYALGYRTGHNNHQQGEVTPFVTEAEAATFQLPRTSEPPKPAHFVCLSFDEVMELDEAACEADIQDTDAARVHAAMEYVATTAWPHDLQLLMENWDQPQTSWDFAHYIARHAREHQLDPLLLTALVWTESKFRAKNLGDYRNGKPRSCGCTQVMTVFKGRPKCEQLLDPDFAIGWTANHLQGFLKKCKGKLCLRKYNGGNYETRLWRLSDEMRRALL